MFVWPCVYVCGSYVSIYIVCVCRGGCILIEFKFHLIDLDLHWINFEAKMALKTKKNELSTSTLK